MENGPNPAQNCNHRGLLHPDYLPAIREQRNDATLAHSFRSIIPLFSNRSQSMVSVAAIFRITSLFRHIKEFTLMNKFCIHCTIRFPSSSMMRRVDWL
jgi:hypothetical protein